MEGSQRQTIGVNPFYCHLVRRYFNESDPSCVQTLTFAIWYAQKFNQMLNYILTWVPNSWLIPLFLIKEITKIKFNIAFTYSSKREHLPISFSHLRNSCLFNARDQSFYHDKLQSDNRIKKKKEIANRICQMFCLLIMAGFSLKMWVYRNMHKVLFHIFFSFLFWWKYRS